MKLYLGNFVIDPNNQGGFTIEELADGVLFTQVICTGTNLGYNTVDGKYEWTYH